MDRKNLKVLVLDDDPDIGTMIRAMLKLRGYDVTVTENAAGMFSCLSQGPVHLILSDMLLSGDDGTDICSKLKADPATSDIPVIMFSAHPNARELCLKAGADAFIGKPFDIQELYATVDEMATKLTR
jgi:CheY-like chemotaxis protein